MIDAGDVPPGAPGTRSSAAAVAPRPRHTSSAGSQRSDDAARTRQGAPAATTSAPVSTRPAPIAQPEPVTPTRSSRPE
ncbi:hypothetical protein MF672_045580 [Actinomadura sp. ATCC 31491]|uniref:Uncharacterized protein n=1 Tax=Actinomadura luzonensis TaxID=2805427 RepID=A0ABT0G9G0_9ACTN|nr:hypothetical protein [Actinomadura luzonensis]MCK2221028.1 hypothetical protein [Actinomadura luzonensis]